MIIIRIQGGLGNQLFQYALYENFKRKGLEVKVDISDYTSGRESRELELGKLGLHLEVADRQELHRYYADNTILTDRVFRYLWGKKKYRKEKQYDFNPDILNMTDGFLSGYWQSEKYFAPAADEVRNKICFQAVDTDAVRQRERQIGKDNAVSVHVRMGDYLKAPDLYGGICDKEYYRRAIEYIAGQTADPVFYIFSDEPGKAADMFAGYKCRIVTENTGSDSYKDMYLMSRCRHHITANSTFSWWGAWLDDRPGKIVITPPRWNHLCLRNDICCKGWIMMPPAEE